MRVPGCRSEQAIKENARQRSPLLPYHTPIGLAILLVLLLHYSEYLVAMLRSSEGTKGGLSQSSQAKRRGATPQPRRWCMLTKGNVPKNEGKWFGTLEHFPHTLEWYVDCWTWLQEQSGFAGAKVLGGFLIDDSVKKKLHKKYWNRAFIPAMQFPVKMWTNHTELEEEVDYSIISTKYYDGGWFQRDDMCSSFRERLWKNLGVHPRNYSKKHKRIGILNRNESRAIVNVNHLAGELQRHYKGSAVEIRAFDSEYELKHEDDTLQNQAKWFADKDLIIMAHGAAMSNVIFMRPGTAVFELFPRYYMNNMFWDLMAQCSLYHSWYYDGNMTDRYTQQIAQTETDEQWKFRMQHKKSDIDYKWKDVDHIIRMLLKAVDADDQS